MDSGLPVVIRSVGGIRDFFRNGRPGHCMTSPDPKVLGRLIEILVRNQELCDSISLHNYQYAQERSLTCQGAAGWASSTGECALSDEPL